MGTHIHAPFTFPPRYLNNSSVLEIQLQRAQNSVRARSKFRQSVPKFHPERARNTSVSIRQIRVQNSVRARWNANACILP